MSGQLVAPFPYFGGKRRVANVVWERLGDPRRYIEPFAGSLAVLLARPWEPGQKRVEIVNDIDGFVVNFWRATAMYPEAVARWADWPVSEVDMIARSRQLFRDVRFLERMKADPEYCSPKIAGWWVWLMCGGTFANIIRRDLGNAALPNMKGYGQGITQLQPRPQHEFILNWMRRIQARLREVQIAGGDWSRVLTPNAFGRPPTAAFLDPPYDVTARDAHLYGDDHPAVWPAVCQWCEERGDDPGLRIALCGYDGTWEPPEEWTVFGWAARPASFGTPAANTANRLRERIWFSPHCLPPRQRRLL